MTPGKYEGLQVSKWELNMSGDPKIVKPRARKEKSVEKRMPANRYWRSGVEPDLPQDGPKLLPAQPVVPPPAHVLASRATSSTSVFPHPMPPPPPMRHALPKVVQPPKKVAKVDKSAGMG